MTCIKIIIFELNKVTGITCVCVYVTHHKIIIICFFKLLFFFLLLRTSVQEEMMLIFINVGIFYIRATNLSLLIYKFITKGWLVYFIYEISNDEY